jgi:hypothetical protein
MSASTRRISCALFRRRCCLQVSVLLLHLLLRSKNTIQAAAAMSTLHIISDDALFACIEEQQLQHAPFGRVLDAGSGSHSLRWLASLPTVTNVTAITADRAMCDTLLQQANQKEVQTSSADTSINVHCGTWFSSKLQSILHEQHFDVVLADYLIGAMDGFGAQRCQQDLMIPQLAQHLQPGGGRLYVVGLEPIVGSITYNNNSEDDDTSTLIGRVCQTRDACILLAGHKCYREYPLEWIQRQVKACPELKLIDSHKFPIVYRHATIAKQIAVGRSKLKLFQNEELASAMEKTLDRLEHEALQACEENGGSIQHGFDYVVTAERV